MLSGERLVGLDLLRVALIALVICHHVACAFGDVGAWYFIIPPPVGSLALLPFTMFAAVNQSFFMSLFFFISGYFTAPAYDRKGTATFLKDRAIRLGIPLLVYFFLLNPSVVYLSFLFRGETSESYLAWMAQYWLLASGSGPLWFVLTLLLFTAAYALWRAARPAAAQEVRVAPLPRHGQILGFVLAAGVAAFLVRLVFPVGTEVFNLQLGYYPLYLCSYALGAVAYRRSWLDQLRPDLVRPWFLGALAFIAAMPVAVSISSAGAGGEVSGGTDPFTGGWTWQAYAYAAWEPVLCVGISLKLLSAFMSRFREQTSLRARASKSAYTVYIIHPFFVVVGTWWLAAAPMDPLLKFAVLSPVAVLSCFAVSDLVRRAPFVRRIV